MVRDNLIKIIGVGIITLGVYYLMTKEIFPNGGNGNGYKKPSIDFVEYIPEGTSFNPSLRVRGRFSNNDIRPHNYKISSSVFVKYWTGEITFLNEIYFNNIQGGQIKTFEHIIPINPGIPGFCLFTAYTVLTEDTGVIITTKKDMNTCY